MPTLLTDPDRVKQRLGLDTTEHDELIERLIEEVSSDFEHRASRTIAQATYTEYCSGDGTRRLVLRHGPLVSVTSLECVSWSKDSAGDSVETRTTVDPGDYRAKALRSDGCTGAGYIELLNGTFARGLDNYRVVYPAGWTDDLYAGEPAAIPFGLIQVVTSRVCEMFNLRDLAGLTDRTEGDASRATIPEANRETAWSRAVWPWRLGEV